MLFYGLHGLCLGTRLNNIYVLTPLIQTINMTSCIQFLSWHMYLNLLESLEVARPGFRKFDSKYYIEGIKNAFPISQLHNANFPHNLVPRLFPLRAARRVVERAWVRGCFPHCMVLNKGVKIVVSSSRFYMPE